MLKEGHFIHVIRCVFLLLPFSIIDWNNPLIINKMYKVYLGDVPLKTKVCKLDISKSIFHFFYINYIILIYVCIRGAI